jgi:hypothetical protein
MNVASSHVQANIGMAPNYASMTPPQYMVQLPNGQMVPSAPPPQQVYSMPPEQPVSSSTIVHHHHYGNSVAPPQFAGGNFGDMGANPIGNLHGHCPPHQPQQYRDGNHWNNPYLAISTPHCYNGC